MLHALSVYDLRERGDILFAWRKRLLPSAWGPGWPAEAGRAAGAAAAVFCPRWLAD